MKTAEQIVAENTKLLIFASDNPVHETMNFLSQNGIFFQVLLGSYKNELETSYLVSAGALQHIIDAGLVSNQESVLVLDEMTADKDRPAKIVYFAEGTPDDTIGKLTMVPKEEALASESWTFNPAVNRYFVVK